MTLRRLVCASVAGALFALCTGGTAGATRAPAVAGSGGDEDRAALHLAPFSPADPLRVTVFGDSVPYVAEPAIAAALGATEEVAVTDGAFPGFGLDNDPTWASTHGGIATLVSSDHAQVVLATWSWDDLCSAADRSRGDACALTDPTAFRGELERAVRLMLGPGGAEGVVFLQFPIGGPDTADGVRPGNPTTARDAAGERAFNRVAASLPAAFPGRVLYLPVAGSVLLDGAYTPWLPPIGEPDAPKRTWVRVRMTDGVHFCPAGAARYADAILGDLTARLHLSKAAAGWQDQAWVSDARFTAGSCPADHPPG